MWGGANGVIVAGCWGEKKRADEPNEMGCFVAKIIDSITRRRNEFNILLRLRSRPLF